MRISDWSSEVCSSDLTSATTLRRCEAGRSDQSISKRDAVSTNAALKPSASSSRNRATTRMKKVRSEEHTSELQSLMRHLVCRLLLEKKKQNKRKTASKRKKQQRMNAKTHRHQEYKYG